MPGGTKVNCASHVAVHLLLLDVYLLFDRSISPAVWNNGRGVETSVDKRRVGLILPDDPG